MAIIQSLLDNDLYKFRMQEAAWVLYPEAQVEYAFQCRTPGTELDAYAKAINREIQKLGRLRLSAEELSYLGGLTGMRSDYLAMLADFRLRPQEQVQVTPCGEGLSIRVRGSWYETILYEVPILAIVNEVYQGHLYPSEAISAPVTPVMEAATYKAQSRQRLAYGQSQLEEKIERLREEPVTLIEMGTRRRYARLWQEQILRRMKAALPEQALAGTSNVDLARRLGLAPIGTMAHEWLQAHQALSPSLERSQRDALKAWMQLYPFPARLALTDVISRDAFLKDFTPELARHYAGVRQDSGDPYAWGEAMIANYQRLGVDPQQRTLVFSDSLDVPEAQSIARAFQERANVAFGIGTNLTNDLDFKPLNSVMKLVRVNGQAVAKISDDPGKAICEDQHFLDRLTDAFELERRSAQFPDACTIPAA